MTNDELERVGIALFGKQWQTPLADWYGVNDRVVRFWLSGERAIPWWIAKDIATKANTELRKKQKEIREIVHDLAVIMARFEHSEPQHEPVDG